MFRAAAPGPYDEAVAKATDENLTSEDWGSIMEVCDRVSSDTNGSQQAVQALIKRLAHRNANVQLYTLELGNALSQNCGKPMHRELASRAFTDALLKLANDRNTHTQVKAKILERMKEWSDMFSKDADLGIMYDAYFRLKQSNPQLQPPSAPQKNSLTELDRQKEEDELQMALKLSLQEEERKKSVQQPVIAGPSSSSAAPQEPAAAAAPLQPMPSGTTAATVSRVRALYDFVPSEPGELEFKRGDVIAVLESVYKDWWRGSLKGKTGIFPLNYVEKLTDPTPDELQREAQMEAEVFAEIKNVEKLLTLLSTNSAPKEEDNEEISKLYHQTLAIRPKLIKLIEKYSQKKDDFTQLNEKFIKARRDYEALLESSMSHPPQPSYQSYALRPAIPQGYGGPSGLNYPGQAPPPQEAQGYGAPSGPGYAQQPASQETQRFYTPGPAQDQVPHAYQAYSAQQNPQSTPSPAFQRPGGTPAPFFLAGAEVPPTGGAPAQHSYPPHEPGQRVPSAGQQPDVPPIQTTTSPPPANQYVPYSRPPVPGSQPPADHQQRPGAYDQQRQSTYGPGSGPGNPQELATSAYDSPIATHNPQSSAAYNNTTSAYSPDDGPSAPSEPSYPAPSAPSAVPGSLMPGGQARMEGAPSPLQPSGPAYDSRQGLPSQHGGQPTQYKPYVPPPSAY